MKINKSDLLQMIREAYYESLKPPRIVPTAPEAAYVEGDDLIGQRVWLHTNRTNRNEGRNGMVGIYNSSPRGTRTGSPIAYTNAIRLEPPIRFQTSESGAKQIVKTGKRTLVAGVSGVVTKTNEVDPAVLSEFEEASFHPAVGHFFSVTDPEQKEILSGEEIYFHASEAGDWKLMVRAPVLASDVMPEEEPSQELSKDDLMSMVSEVMDEEQGEDIKSLWQQTLLDLGFEPVPPEDVTGLSEATQMNLPLSDPDEDEDPEETLPLPSLRTYKVPEPEEGGPEKVPAKVQDVGREVPLVSLTPDALGKSGFCKYNPQINEWVKESPENLAETILFVYATQRTDWPTVMPYFPHLMEWITTKDADPNAANPSGWSSPRNRKMRENYPMNKNPDLVGSGMGFGSPKAYLISLDLLKHEQYRKLPPEELIVISNGVSKVSAVPATKTYFELWGNRQEVYNNMIGLLKSADTNPLDVMTVFLTIKGLGLAKAGFATQMVTGKLGCVDSINSRMFYGDDIPKVLSKSKPKNLRAFAQEYINVLNELADIGYDSQKLWDFWTKIVAFQINNPGDYYAAELLRRPTKKGGEPELHVVPNLSFRKLYPGKTVSNYRARLGLIGPVTGADVSGEHRPFANPLALKELLTMVEEELELSLDTL
tara:strand:+ start:298 stop:2253 length:1956 start_codon:yes stop_codon:yes gene_type:complete